MHRVVASCLKEMANSPRIAAACLVAFVGLLISGPARTEVPYSPQSTSISISLVGDHFELTVPVGHATMLLPRGNFEVQEATRSGAAASPRHFWLQDKTSGAIVTGWLESARRVTDPGEVLRKSWPTEAAGLSNKGMAPHDIENRTIGPWQAITFKITSEKEVSSNIRATQIVADTWVDLHLSVTRPLSDESTDSEVLKLLQSLSFTTR